MRALLASAPLAALVACPLPALAQFDASKVYVEAPAVAARFPDPDVPYSTPAFDEDQKGFPSHEQAFLFAQGLTGRSLDAQSAVIGKSQKGRAIPMVTLAKGGIFNPDLPTVLIIGQQHGNEPAGGEAALAVAERIAVTESKLLERVNVLVIPRANPDGAQDFKRTTANGADVNRDHLLLRTPEARAIADVIVRYRPAVVLDLHEFTVGGRWIDKFGVVERYDALLQPATVANLDPGIAKIAENDFVAPVRAMLERNGYWTFSYHTTSQDPADKVVAMGGVQADTGRNVNGLRPAISILIEVRGVGLGRAHLKRRVHTQVLAATEIVAIAARMGPRLSAAVEAAGRRIAQQACKGTLVVDAGQRRTTQKMTFLDAQSGEEKTLDVEWRSATPLEVVRARSRPCGYLVSTDENVALDQLRLLGVRTEKAPARGKWDVETYAIVSEKSGKRMDARGAIDDPTPIRTLEVKTARSRFESDGEWVYVPMDQPLAALVAAALEPDSQSSYVASWLVAPKHLMRVMRKPLPAATKTGARGR